MIKGYCYPDRELMADVSQWGTYGWSYLAEDLAGAEKKYASLLPEWGESRPIGLAEQADYLFEEALAGAGGRN